MRTADWLRVRIGSSVFAFRTDAVQDVFTPGAMTPVPRASAEVAGILNLRGRIVTVIRASRVLGLPDPVGPTDGQAVGFAMDGDLYGLWVDRVEDVVPISDDAILAPPAVPDRWAGVVDGLARVCGELVIVSRPAAFVFPSRSQVQSPSQSPVPAVAPLDPETLLEAFAR